MANWQRSAMRDLTAFFDYYYVPSRTKRLPYYIFFYDVAYATYAHIPSQTDDSVLYEFIGNDKARKSPYTLTYLLSARGLAEYIILLFLNKLSKLSRIYESCARGNYLARMAELQVEEGGETHARFVSLVEMTLNLYSSLCSSNVEIGELCCS